MLEYGDNLTLGSFHHARLDDTCGLTAPCLLDVAIIGVDDSGLVHARRGGSWKPRRLDFTAPEGIDPSCVLGTCDGVLRALESLVRAHVVARGDSIAVSGDPDEVELVARFFRTRFFARRLRAHAVCRRCLSLPGRLARR